MVFSMRRYCNKTSHVKQKVHPEFRSEISTVLEIEDITCENFHNLWLHMEIHTNILWLQKL